MRLLELFSGTKSVGRAFEALGWEVTSLDTDATTRPTICADIQEWDYRTYPPGHFDFIWASPVCTEFSRALTRRPRRLTEGDGLVLKTIEIIGHLRSRWWAVENPRGPAQKSALHASAALQHGRCEAFRDGRHPETAQRQGSQTRNQLYSLPPRLCQEIAESLNGKGEALPDRRVHLETASRPDRSPRAVHGDLPRALEIGEDGGSDLSHPGPVHDERR